jgi:hypothetical protein
MHLISIASEQVPCLGWDIAQRYRNNEPEKARKERIMVDVNVH